MQGSKNQTLILTPTSTSFDHGHTLFSYSCWLIFGTLSALMFMFANELSVSMLHMWLNFQIPTSYLHAMSHWPWCKRFLSPFFSMKSNTAVLFCGDGEISVHATKFQISRPMGTLHDNPWTKLYNQS
jgi:hypothetical protein